MISFFLLFGIGGLVEDGGPPCCCGRSCAPCAGVIIVDTADDVAGVGEGVIVVKDKRLKGEGGLIDRVINSNNSASPLCEYKVTN